MAISSSVAVMGSACHPLLLDYYSSSAGSRRTSKRTGGRASHRANGHRRYRGGDGAGTWTQHKFKLSLQSDAENTNNSFALFYEATAGESLNFNLVSLFPLSYQTRLNGNRPDLMQLLCQRRPNTTPSNKISPEDENEPRQARRQVRRTAQPIAVPTMDTPPPGSAARVQIMPGVVVMLGATP